MKRKHVTAFIPKIAIAAILSILLVLVIVGVYRDWTGELCNGFMGARASCLEETAFWPFGLIGIVLIGFFGAWWCIDYMNKSIRSKQSKKK